MGAFAPETNKQINNKPRLQWLIKTCDILCQQQKHRDIQAYTFLTHVVETTWFAAHRCH